MQGGELEQHKELEQLVWSHRTGLQLFSDSWPKHSEIPSVFFSLDTTWSVEVKYHTTGE